MAQLVHFGNGVLGSFQKNWVSPELQMSRKFLTYQALLQIDTATSLPSDLKEFFQSQMNNRYTELSVGEGSLEQTQTESLDLMNYRKNCDCDIHFIKASESNEYSISRRSESLFTSSEISSLTEVYCQLYPGVTFSNQVHKFHEKFHQLKIYNVNFLSANCKGKHSPAVSAYWAGLGGSIANSCDKLRVGSIQYFVRHLVEFFNGDYSSSPYICEGLLV